MEEILGPLVPIAFFAMIAAIIIAPRYYKSVERQKLADTMRAAIDKGQPMPPEVIEVLTQKDLRLPPAPKSDLRRGVIWLALAVGGALFGLCLGYWEPDAAMPFLALSAIPGCVGIGFLILAWLNKPKP